MTIQVIWHSVLKNSLQNLQIRKPKCTIENKMENNYFKNGIYFKNKGFFLKKGKSSL